MNPQRTVVYDKKAIRQLVKEVSSEDFDEVEDFKKNIDNVKNVEVGLNASDLIGDAIKLREVWKIARGL